ncbi:MAG: type II toxin-antitoxin system VapC family toxin [Candidatus Wenzhouxiangella sp. M2_3B_020]
MIVLDTHALVWWANGEDRLSGSAADAIEAEHRQSGRILLSTMSAWEIAMLIDRGRMALAMDLDEWLDTVDRIEAVEWIPVSRQLAVDSVTLPGDFHPDPADRLIVALARRENAELVTADGKIHAYPHVRSIW